MYNILAKLVFIFVLCIIYFVVKTENTIYDQLSFIFIMFGYLLFVFTPYFTKNRLNKTIQDLPVYSTAFWYLLWEILLALYTCYCGFESSGSYILTQTISTGIFLIIFFITLDINEQTSKNIEAQTIDIEYINDIKRTLRNLLSRTDDTNCKQSIENLLDSVNASPVKSNENVYNLEKEILAKVENLDNTNTEKFMEDCSQIEQLIQERNNNLR